MIEEIKINVEIQRSPPPSNQQSLVKKAPKNKKDSGSKLPAFVKENISISRLSISGRSSSDENSENLSS